MALTDSGSDGENGEKPVRERLKQTTIDKVNPDGSTTDTQNVSADTDMTPSTTETTEADTTSKVEVPRKKPGRKRSLEDVGAADSNQDPTQGAPATPSAGGHLRKKYREVQENQDVNPKDDDDAKNSVDTSVEMHTPPAVPQSSNSEALLSPTRKRSRENLEAEDREQKIPATEETRARRSSEEERPDLTAETKDTKPTQPEKLANGTSSIPQSSSTTTSKIGQIPSSSGFANTSVVSPFGSLSKSKSPTSSSTSTEIAPAPSNSAFSASGFASMSSASSPFGTLAAASSTNSKTSSPSPPPQATFGSLSGAITSGFGSASTSTFGGSSTTFGSSSGPSFGGGGGVATSFGGGARLSSFAAPVGDAKLGAEAEAKPFGAAESEDDASDSNEEGEDGDESTPAPKEEESEVKFKVQEDRDTGEEGEETVYTNKAKLFHFDKEGKQWKERGAGAIKVNIPEKKQANSEDLESGSNNSEPTNSEQRKKIPRLLMRVQQTHKLILNATIFKQMSVKENGNKTEPFTVPSPDGKDLEMYLLRMSRDSDIKAFCEAIKKIQEKL